MARITQHLWFEKDMEAALNCYVALIPGSSVNWFSDLPADTPSGPAGSVKLASFTWRPALCGDRSRAVGSVQPQLLRDGGMRRSGGGRPAVGRVVRGRRGGAVRLAARSLGVVLADVPRRLTELMNDPDAARVRRVTEAMLLMGKIDIAGLEAAARG